MAKKIDREIEEIEDEIEDLDSLDDDEEFEALEKMETKKNINTKGIYNKSPPKKEEVKERFAAFSQPSRIGIIDRETNEILAEGDFLIPQILAQILERLEKIEANIGTLLPE